MLDSIGTFSANQQPPIFAKAKPAPMGYLLATFTLKPTQGKRERAAPAGHAYTMQLDILAILPPHEPIPCRHAALISPRTLATFTADQLDTTAHNVNRADQLQPLATMPDKPTLHSRHHWQQCHRPAIARAYQNRNRNKNNCALVY
jgi:hypothetical protein